jgi:hypothetical protein
MTSEELKAILKSKTNKLAGEAIECIERGAPLAELQTLVEAGASEVYYRRDPAHPRSRFQIRAVIDSCFETKFGVVAEETQETQGHTVNVLTLGEVHRSEGLLPHFRYLLSKGFQPGENGYRGALFQHILNSCFYRIETPEKQRNARAFAKVLAETGAYNIQRYADNNYGWVNNPESLDFILSLGADPAGSGMIDCALNYVACSPNSGEEPGGRIAVVRKLLDLGAVPKKDLGRAISWQHIREALIEAGLLERVATFGAIQLEHPQGYLEWLQRCGKPLPTPVAA